MKQIRKAVASCPWEPSYESMSVNELSFLKK